MYIQRVVLSAILVSSAISTELDGVVQGLNQRFNMGKPSDDMNSAGVLLHHFSHSHAGLLGEPWRPYSREECELYNYPRCNTTADRACAYISNNRRRNYEDGNIIVFSVDIGGIIYNPDKNKAMCLYSEDAGSDDRENRGCGCHANDAECIARGTNNSCVLDIKAGVNDVEKCWWGPDRLKTMMHLQSFSMYNEIVLDTDVVCPLGMTSYDDKLCRFQYICLLCRLCGGSICGSRSPCDRAMSMRAVNCTR